MTPSPDTLREMLERATPGEWKAFIQGNTVAVGLAPNPGGNPAIANWNGFDSSGESLKRQKANARLIVAMHEALPALLDRLDAQQALIEFALQVVQRGVDLMGVAQVSQWEGVRAFLEMADAAVLASPSETPRHE